jgi:hypothetical protein
MIPPVTKRSRLFLFNSKITRYHGALFFAFNADGPLSPLALTLILRHCHRHSLLALSGPVLAP